MNFEQCTGLRQGVRLCGGGSICNLYGKAQGCSFLEVSAMPGGNIFGDALPFGHRGPQNSLVPQTELEWNDFFALSGVDIFTLLFGKGSSRNLS